jgi:ABC-type sulfate/molybdate transport systems ATPase subunit
MRPPTALTLQTRRVSQDLRQQRACTWQVTLPDSDGMYGLLGPNGAGKSRIPATVQEPDGGNVRLGDANETVCS